MMDGRTARPVGSAGDDLHLLMKIPTGVREVIGKRLNRLSASAGRLLAIAACIGRSFELDLLARAGSRQVGRRSLARSRRRWRCT